jgi:hypothetical protein
MSLSPDASRVFGLTMLLGLLLKIMLVLRLGALELLRPRIP